jgi:hypothetical protein
MITAQGLIIGTGILWVLSALVVSPLTTYVLKQRLMKPAYSHIEINQADAASLPEVKSLAIQSYILVDTLVLATAGFLMGVTCGWYFIGISFEVKGWPGMIAFIGMSILGSSLHSSIMAG